jgi:hypothetical protein
VRKKEIRNKKRCERRDSREEAESFVELEDLVIGEPISR